MGKEEVPPSGTKGSLLTACRGRRTLGVPQLRARRPPRPGHGECVLMLLRPAAPWAVKPFVSDPLSCLPPEPMKRQPET